MTTADQIIDLYKNIDAPYNLPLDVEVLNPFQSNEVQQIVDQFYRKHYSDNNPRTFLIGINPGRLGSGTTGIPFTDPIRLKEILLIENSFKPTTEISSKFIYQMIERFGGAHDFYSSFYFTSVSLLGFIKEGKNLNYYDIKLLQDSLEEYIVTYFRKQLAFGANPIAFSIGKGKNIKYLKWLNKKYHLFEDIKPLPHPRWVMQYRSSRIDEFIEEYYNQLKSYI